MGADVDLEAVPAKNGAPLQVAHSAGSSAARCIFLETHYLLAPCL
jgi:hypothetical protein